jgi:DNA-binding GntR family transcriptional regulator
VQNAIKKDPRSKAQSCETRTVGGGASKLGDLAYQQLQKKLVNGELAAGDKISEVQLAADLGMSRTPVREAIRRLEIEGVLQPVASSGTFVKPAERSKIIELFELRIAIESFAVQKATRRMKRVEVKHLGELCDQMLAAIRDFRDSGVAYLKGKPLQRYLNADIEFHQLLLKAAENRQALAIYNDLHLRSAIFGCRSHQRDLHHVAWVWLQHNRVVRWVRQRDARKALQALEKHMYASMAAALEAYDARLAGRSSAGAAQPEFTKAYAAFMSGRIRPAT